VEGYSDGHCFPADRNYLEEVYEVGKQLYTSFLGSLSMDSAALASIDETYRLGYARILQDVADGQVSLEDALDIDKLLKPGALRTRGTLIWRPQAGPWSHWALQGEGTEFEQACRRDLVAPFASIVLLGVPAKLSAPHCAAVERQLERLGLYSSRAPNSVWLKRIGTNKGLPIRWLADATNQAAKEFDFQLDHAVSFGDNPCGNDGPLADFQDRGMSFISVGDDANWCGMQVGGFEVGCAVVLEQLVRSLENGEELSFAESDMKGLSSQVQLMLNVSDAASGDAPSSRL